MEELTKTNEVRKIVGGGCSTSKVFTGRSKVEGTQSSSRRRKNDARSEKAVVPPNSKHLK